MRPSILIQHNDSNLKQRKEGVKNNSERIIKIHDNLFKKVEDLEFVLKRSVLFMKLYDRTVIHMGNRFAGNYPVLDMMYLSFSMANFIITTPYPEQYFNQLADAVSQYADPQAFPYIADMTFAMIAFIKPEAGKADTSKAKKLLIGRKSNDEWLSELYYPPDYGYYHDYDFHDFDGCITVEENVVPLMEWNLEPDQKTWLNHAHIILKKLKEKDAFGNDMISDENYDKTVRLFDNFIINGAIPDLEGEHFKTGWDAQSIKEVFYEISKLYHWQNIYKDNNGRRFVTFMHHVFAAFDGIAESTTYRKFAQKRTAKEQSLASH